jgi:hypothetical protein
MGTGTEQLIRSVELRLMRVPNAPADAAIMLKKAKHFADNEAKTTGSVAAWNRDQAKRLLHKLEKSVLSPSAPERKPRQVGKTERDRAKGKAPSIVRKQQRAKVDQQVRNSMRGSSHKS